MQIKPLRVRLVRFLLGTTLLFCLICLLASLESRIGITSELVSRNIAKGRDAGALFYTELDDYWELQAALEAQQQGTERGGSPGAEGVRPVGPPK